MILKKKILNPHWVAKALKILNPHWIAKALDEYSKTRVFFGFLLIVVFMIYSSFLVFSGGYLQRAGFYYKIVRHYIVETKTTVFNYYRSFFFEPNHINIDIKHKDYMKLEYTRNLAIQRGTLYGVVNWGKITIFWSIPAN